MNKQLGEKGKLLMEYQLTYLEEIWGNQHLAIILVITDSVKNHQWMLKYWVKAWWGTGYTYKISKHLPQTTYC